MISKICYEKNIRAAALQFARKLSGYRKPVLLNQAAFEAAVTEVTEATRKLLKNIQVQQSTPN